MTGRLFDAAGNRILWLRATDCACETDFGRLKNLGLELARRSRFGQELTAILFPSPTGHRALFWNPDDSFERLCGNAIRCLGHFLHGSPGINGHVRVQTPSGTYTSRRLSANHGSIVIPAQSIRVVDSDAGADLLVDVGTPHRIRLVECEWPEADVQEALARSAGADPVNFNLVRRVEPFQFRVRTFERGVGETFSCGTAAAAVVAALGPKCLDFSSPPVSSRVQFASGEQLTVIHNLSDGSYEIAGRVAILQDVSL